MDEWLLPRKITLNQDDDPRQGSARNDSDGTGTLSALNGSQGSSLAKLGATFIPVSIFVAVSILLFIFLRKKMKRVYSPRTIAALRYPQQPSPQLPDGWLDWAIPFFKIPDTYVLNHGSIDGFFFLRYLKVIRNVCIAGCFITWPVLLPINATGGRGLKELEKMTLGNVADPKKLLAHALVACVYFGFIIFIIVRECIYFINLRQAYLSSPYYADRLSSRTVLLTSVPKPYLDEQRLRKLYGDSVKRVWIPKTSKDLVNLVKERKQTAERLEKAEILLIKKAQVARLKEEKRTGKAVSIRTSTESEGVGKSDEVIRQTELQETKEAKPSQIPLPSSAPQTPIAPTLPLSSASSSSIDIMFDTQAETGYNKIELENASVPEDTTYQHPYGYSPSLPDLRGSVAAQWVAAEDRPYHRPLGNFFRRVDTIRWTRNRLRDLNLQIYKLRRSIRREKGSNVTVPAAFIEFDTQEAAQAAQQVLAHHSPLQMSPRLLGIRPDEVVWSALAIPWWQRIIRRFAMLGLITAAIIFWSIPSVFVGLLSSVEFLSKNVPFLTWIVDLPKPILGFIQGFVPAIVLSLFMSLVPAMMRICARVAGVPSHSKVELFTQTAYFGFQIVQVFLVTTLTSAASGAFFDVLKAPMSAPTVLATNLPAASNFYISYILIQCLAAGAMTLIHPFDLLRHLILPKLSSLPRVHYRLWRNMMRPWWGKEFPIFANLAVIAMAYSCIAPLILIFAAGGMAFLHMVWRYNLLYVYDSEVDSKGLFYPRALLHLIVGMYVATICLIGLFGLNKAFGPMVLMVLFLVVAALIHISLNGAIAPFLSSLPQTLAFEEQIREEERVKAEQAASRREGRPENEGAAASYYDTEENFGEEDEDYDTPPSDVDDDDNDHQINGTRAVEGSSSVKHTLTSFLTSRFRSSARQEATNSGLAQAWADLRTWYGSDRHGHGPSALARFFHPEIHEDFLALRKLLPAVEDVPEILYPDEHRRTFCQYLPPEMWVGKPMIWIPEDEGRVSRQEVDHSRKWVGISDTGARLDAEGRVVIDLYKAPYEEPRLLL